MKGFGFIAGLILLYAGFYNFYNFYKLNKLYMLNILYYSGFIASGIYIILK